MTRRFALLDRDGTINEEVGHLADPADVRLVPGAAAALRELHSAGIGLVVVTNQANVGRGTLSRERLEEIHARLTGLLHDQDAGIDGLYVCPHTPEDGCDCRKPKPGMAIRAAADHGFDLTEAFVVGDHGADLRMGRAVGATTLLVLTGHGTQELEDGAREHADHVVADLAEAASVIRDLVRPGPGP